MLAERFQEVVDDLATEAQEKQAARLARDAFIQTGFAALDAAFVAMLAAATGSHARLAVVSTAVTDTITTRSFASLAKTVSEVRSTLYGPVERVVFTPGLEFKSAEQFGVIGISTENLEADFGGGADAELLESIMDRGVLMRGRDAASLVVESGESFQALDATLLEELLARLFIRTG